MAQAWSAEDGKLHAEVGTLKHFQSRWLSEVLRDHVGKVKTLLTMGKELLRSFELLPRGVWSGGSRSGAGASAKRGLEA